MYIKSLAISTLLFSIFINGCDSTSQEQSPKINSITNSNSSTNSVSSSQSSLVSQTDLGKQLTGTFKYGNTSGIEFYCLPSNTKGFTDDNGKFTCYENDKVSFNIGSIDFSYNYTFTDISNDITPYSLNQNNQLAAINLTRLLLTLDVDNNPSNGISIRQALLPNNIQYISLIDKYFSELYTFIFGGELVEAIYALENINSSLNMDTSNLDTIITNLYNENVNNQSSSSSSISNNNQTESSSSANSTDSSDTPIVGNIKTIVSGPDFYLATKTDDTSVLWGYGSTFGRVRATNLNNTKAIYETTDNNDISWAALKYDGSVVTWGYRTPKDDSLLVNIKNIYTTDYSFAALTNTGHVITWGNLPLALSTFNYGGDSSEVSLYNVKEVYSGKNAFAALTNDGHVITWGDGDAGDTSTLDLTNVKNIVSTDGSFLALKNDGTAIAWGSKHYGGDTKNIDLTNIKKIYSNKKDVFSVLKNDGTVISWGYYTYIELSNIKDVHMGNYTFSAIKNDGSIVIWENVNNGFEITSTIAAAESTDIQSITSNGWAFAALRGDGTVVTWGRSSYGGDSSAVELSNVVSIYSTDSSFAALKKDGTVVTWGISTHGGDSSAVELNNVIEIYPSKDAYTAVKADGTITTWGNGYSSSEYYSFDINQEN